MRYPSLYSTDASARRKSDVPASSFNRPAISQPSEPKGFNLPKAATPNASALGLRGRLKLSGIARDAMVQALGEMIVNEVRLTRDAALHDGRLKLAQHKSLALRDFLEANTVISGQIERISRAAEAEMVATFYDEMAAIITESGKRLASIAEPGTGSDERLTRYQREAIERWTDIQLGNIEARMTLILQRYAQQFEATLAQFDGANLGGA